MKTTCKILLITIMLLTLVVGFMACNDGDEVLTSLPTPENLAASGSTISWKAVDGATSYEVVVQDGEARSTENTYFNLDLTSKGKYLIKVRAVGKNANDEIIYSEYAEYTLTKTAAYQSPEHCKLTAL